MYLEVKKNFFGLIFPPAFLSDSISRNSSSYSLCSNHTGLLSVLWMCPRASALALFSSWDILPPKKFTWLVPSHLIMDVPTQVSVFQKGLLFPFSESTSITVYPISLSVFFMIPFRNYFLKFSYPFVHEHSLFPATECQLHQTKDCLILWYITRFQQKKILSTKALHISSFIEQILWKSALIFLMVYLQLYLVICCDWVGEGAYF